MKKIYLVMTAIILLSMSLANAITQQEISEAKTLIDSKVDCKSLSDSQLEIIGEYYMEQMMPGISHERAHEMMGLREGTEAEEQFHINFARRSYCGENIGMMGGGGMMGNNYQTQQYNDPSSFTFNGFKIFFYALLILIIIAIILIILLLINKQKKQRRNNKHGK